MRESADRTAALAWSHVFRQAFALLLLALVPAMLMSWLQSSRPAAPDIAEISVADAKSLAAQHPVLWIDARSAQAYATAHIAGAIPLSLATWEESLPGFIQAWQPGQVVIVYCGSADCDLSRAVARRLKREFQISDVRVLQGGWETWRASGP